MKDPYVYEDTNILINLKNIKNQDELDEYESSLFKLSFIKLKNDNFIIKDVKDVFYIHKALFDKVYSWAGLSRTINIEKSEYVLNGLSVEYSDYSNINNEIEKLNNEFKSINNNDVNIKDITKFISKIWKIHPFREGNTRTVGVFLYFWIKRLDLNLNNDFIGENAKYFRNALVLASIGEYSEYGHLENILKDAIDNKNISLNGNKYKSIKGYDLKHYRYNYHHIK